MGKSRVDESGRRLVVATVCIMLPKQSAELLETDGFKEPVVLLVSSRRHSNKLVLPKGGWEHNETSEQGALRELWEESGVRGGEILSELDAVDGGDWARPTYVHVYLCKPLKVEKQWPEKDERERMWFSRKDLDKLKYDIPDWMLEACRQGGIIEGYQKCLNEPKCWIDSLALDSQCRMEVKCNGELCQPVCVDLPENDHKLEFIKKSLEFQRKLQLDFSVLDAQMLGTHNSFISNSYGIGLEETFFTELFTNSSLYNSYPRTVIANQRLSVRQQLELGVRHLEVDMARSVAVSGSDIKVCHWPIPPPNFLFYLRRAGLKSNGKSVQFLKQCIGASSCAVLDDDDLDETEVELYTELVGKLWDKMWLGCNRNSLTLIKALAEIQKFISDRNHEDFVILYLDNRVSASSYRQFVDILEASQLRVFTPKDLQEKYINSYPSIRTLIKDGYNVMLEIYDKRKQWLKKVPESRDLIFNRDKHWNEFGINNQWLPSKCSIGGVDANQGRFRALDTSLSLGPAKLFNTSEPAIGGKDLEELIKCGVHRVALDQLTPSYLMNAIWAFGQDSKLFNNPSIIDTLISRISSPGKPSRHLKTDGDNCLVYNGLSGKMELSDCKEKSLAVCRNTEVMKSITLSIDLCEKKSECICNQGYYVDLPRTPAELTYINKLLSYGIYGNRVWVF